MGREAGKGESSKFDSLDTNFPPFDTFSCITICTTLYCIALLRHIIAHCCTLLHYIIALHNCIILVALDIFRTGGRIGESFKFDSQGPNFPPFDTFSCIALHHIIALHYCVTLSHIIPHYCTTLLHCIALDHSIALHRIILRYIALNCSALYYTCLHCSA